MRHSLEGRESGSPTPAQKNAVPSQDMPASLTKLR